MELCFDGYWYDTPYTQLGSYCVNIACLIIWFVIGQEPGSQKNKKIPALLICSDLS